MFTLATTNPDFLYNLTDNHAVIRRRERRNGDEFNGTGPFVLQEYVADRAVLTANPDYWAGASGVETLEFIYFDSVDGVVNALRGGVVDSCCASIMRRSSACRRRHVQRGGYPDQRPRPGAGARRPRAGRRRARAAGVPAGDRSPGDLQRTQFGFGAVGATCRSARFARYYSEDTPLPARDPEAARALLAGPAIRRPGDDALRAQSGGPRGAGPGAGRPVGRGRSGSPSSRRKRPSTMPKTAGWKSIWPSHPGTAPGSAGVPRPVSQIRRGVERGALERRRDRPVDRAGGLDARRRRAQPRLSRHPAHHDRTRPNHHPLLLCVVRCWPTT